MTPPQDQIHLVEDPLRAVVDAVRNIQPKLESLESQFSARHGSDRVLSRRSTILSDSVMLLQSVLPVLDLRNAVSQYEIINQAAEARVALDLAHDAIDNYSQITQMSGRPSSTLNGAKNDLLSALADATGMLGGLIDSIAPLIPNNANGFQDKWLRLSSANALEQIQSSADQIKRTEHEVAVSAGIVAAGSMATSFDSYTTAQAVSARWWMAFSVIALAAVVTVGVLLLRAQDPSWQQTVAHLVIALPAAGVAAYGARESSRHRESSQWARRVSAQLKAIGPYVDRLPEAEQNALWSGFGKYIFGPYAASPVENQLQTVPPEILKALTDLVKASK